MTDTHSESEADVLTADRTVRDTGVDASASNGQE